MNERITKQIEEMKKQTIGVEVEMNSIRRDRAAKIAAEFFGTMRYEGVESSEQVGKTADVAVLSLIHISEPTRH